MSEYARLIQRWNELWKEGRVPHDEYMKLLGMQIGWWNRGLSEANADMVGQLESWIGIYERQPLPEESAPPARTTAPASPAPAEDEVFV